MEKEKKKSKNKILYRVIMAILIIIIAVCLYKVGTILYEYYSGSKAYDIVAEAAGTKAFDGTVDFDALWKQNKDVRAWIYSKDTPINYPVVQGTDNDYYLYRMINGKSNGKGSIFIDYRCENPFTQFNTIVYGHRMKDGSMFHDLIKYREDGYYENHKTMMIVTPEQKYTMHVFAALTIPGDSTLYRMDFSDTADKQAYLDEILSKNEVNTGVTATVDDELVMLSTCTYEFDNARLVVFGKLEAN